eukprot:1082253-Pelagomonas_calceolata.AAC.1
MRLIGLWLALASQKQEEGKLVTESLTSQCQKSCTLAQGKGREGLHSCTCLRGQLSLLKKKPRLEKIAR